MDIREMHYGFKFKFNKLDSNQNRNLYIPEIDFILNEALKVFVDNIFFPRDIKQIGFESSQRSIDDLRPLVVKSLPLSVGTNKIVTLPVDYWHFVRADAQASNGRCNRTLRMFDQQHDDMFQESEIYKSDFDWGTLNFTYDSQGLLLHYDNFGVSTVNLTYVKKHPYIHNARDYEGGTYNDLNENILINHQNCELPDDSCRDIVDIAVFLASSYVQDSGYNVHKEKLTINQTN